MRAGGVNVETTPLPSLCTDSSSACYRFNQVGNSFSNIFCSLFIIDTAMFAVLISYIKPGYGLYYVVFHFLVQTISAKRCSGCISNRLLIISMDGFRWDYVNRANNLTSFHRMIHDGGWAMKGLKNSFLTKTFPNHLSIVTGLHEESHGVVGNVMFDPVFNSTFHGWLKEDSENSSWFDNGGEPIWVTNQKQNTLHRSGVIAWPGGMAAMQGFLPYRSVSGFDNFTDTQKVDSIIKWFTDEYPINLGLLYFGEPDHTGHKFGPDSEEIRDKVIELDQVLGYLLDELEEHNLFDHMNIILTSDHGMASLPNDTEHIIDLNKYLDFSTYSVTSTNPVAGIFPNTEELGKEIYKNLSGIPNCHVYLKKEIPTDYYYKDNRRIPPIILVPDEHYWVNYNHSKQKAGQHGYNNSLPSMHPVFIAMGPDFKKGAKVKTFDHLDIYPLMCKLLNLKPAPNNGSLDIVVELLEDVSSDSTTFRAYLLILLFISLVGGVFSVAAGCQVHRHYKCRIGKITSLSLPSTFDYSDRMPLMSDGSDDDL